MVFQQCNYYAIAPCRRIYSKQNVFCYLVNYSKQNTENYQDICSKLNKNSHTIITKIRWPRALLKIPHMRSWYPPEIKLQLCFTTEKTKWTKTHNPRTQISESLVVLISDLRKIMPRKGAVQIQGRYIS